MMDDVLPGYPECKARRAGWLGKLPATWEIVRLKYAAQLIGQKIDPKPHHKYVGMENIESGTGRYVATQDAVSEGLSSSFDKGDVLFGKLRPYLAKTWLAEFGGVCSSEFLVLRGQRVCPEYLKYYTMTEGFVDQVNSSTYGAKMPRASWDFISLLDVPVPSVDEAKTIAHFLDCETAKIDALIEKQQQLIELLREKRQTVINHAITKGLNPNAPMRDSGVEWLGEVPEGWRVAKFTQYINIRHGHQFRDYDFVDEGTKIVKITQLNKDGFLDLSKCSYVSSARLHEFEDIRIVAKDILMCLTGGTIGKIIRVGSVNEPLLQNYRVGHFSSSKSSMSDDYIYYLMSSDAILGQINFLLRETGQPNIGMEDFGEMQICIPNLDAQKEISQYLNEILPKLSKVKDVASSAISYLRERRTALISAAVTGKIDVRDWRAPELDLSNEEDAA